MPFIIFLASKSSKRIWTPLFLKLSFVRNIHLYSKENECKNFFEILGVHRDASTREVKAGFYRKAKEIHPDVNRELSPDEAKKAFHLLSAAYETLMDENARKRYAMSLDAGGPINPGFREEVVRDPNDWGDIFTEFKTRSKPKWAHMKRNKEHTGSSISGIGAAKYVVAQRFDSWYQQICEEFEEALAHAYEGPRFEGAQHEFPWEFESEERRTDHDSSAFWKGDEAQNLPIMELVSGRQLLGKVQYHLDPLLPTHEQIALLQNYQSVVSEASGANAHQQRSNSQNGTGDGQNRNTSKTIELELIWQGFKLAHAVRDFRNGNDSMAVYLHHKEGEGTLFLGTVVGLPGLNQRRPMSSSVLDASGFETHSLTSIWTPGVQHMYWFGNKGKLECRCSRAWRPPSKYWYFQPRNKDHDVGGWYYEIIRDDAKKRQTSTSHTRLHPAIYIFATAFKTLETVSSVGNGDDKPYIKYPIQWYNKFVDNFKK